MVLQEEGRNGKGGAEMTLVHRIREWVIRALTRKQDKAPVAEGK